MRGILIANGEYWNREMLKEEAGKECFIICVDGGMNFAYELGITPNIIIGDMDSADSKIKGFYETLDIPFKLYPKEKDKTDFHLAMEEIIAHNIKEVSVYGISGTRLDHTIGALGVMRKFLRENKVWSIKISLGERATGYIFKEALKVQGERGDIVSLLPLTERVIGIYTYGLKYPLEDGILELEGSLGVSNEILESPCSITIKEGVLLAIHYSGKVA
jgi:thiamine pyrophosphokinase